MDQPSLRQRNARLQLVPRLAGAAVVVIGGLALLGWVFDLAVLKSILPGLSTLKVNTALAFILAGLALAALPLAPAAGVRLPGFVLGCAGAAALLGLLTLFEFMTGLDLGIDQLLFHDPAPPIGLITPGRMAPGTALNFVLIMVALLLLSRDWAVRAGQVCALVVGTIGLLNIVGYVYGVSLPLGFFFSTQVALQTPLAFIIYSAGLLYVRPNRGVMALLISDNPGGVLARRLLPAALVIPFLLGWLWLLGQERDLFNTAFGVALFALSIVLIFAGLIGWTASSLAHAHAVRRRAEEAFRLAEAMYHDIVENAADGIMVTDRDLHILAVNPRYCQMLGYTREELLHLSSVDLLFEDDRPTVAARMAEIQAGNTTARPHRVRRKDGSPLLVEVSATMLADGRVQEIVRDITERNRVEEAVRESERLAEEARRETAVAQAANQAKSEFLSRISHELRTPLNSILGFAQLLQLGDLTERQAEGLDYILKGGRHLLGLVNEVLDIARIESGRLSISPEPVAVSEVLHECLDLVGPTAAQQQVQLVFAAPPGDPHVQADRQRLIQVLLNLLSNAVKFNHAGGRVDVSCAPGAGGAETLRILVSDSGAGIPARALPRLFAPFERLDAAERGIEGTGLGLALSKRLIETMGGTIGVASDPGRGSTFWAELPASAPPRAQPPPASMELPDAASAAHKATVLYVEDNLSNLRLMEHIFEWRPNLRLLPAMQGGLALDLARHNDPDLILLDLHLPDLPGDVVLHRLKSDPQTRHIPVVVVSADATPHQVERLLAAGATAYLTKPLDVSELLHVLETTLADT